MEVREAIRTQPMRRLQVITVLICMVMCMVDGFEILMMAFVAPHLAKAWHLDAVQTGYLLSASVFGSAVGAVFLSPLADHIGRRRHVILCLMFITVGMTLSPFVTSVAGMLACRASTGLFIGAVVVSLNVTVSEYCSDRRRGAVMGVYGIGFPAGAALGGAISAVLIAHFGWQAPFVFGAVLSFMMLAVVSFALPESIDYLIEGRPARALEQYNKIADKLGYPRISTLPEPIVTGGKPVAMTAVFSGIMGKRTVLLWVANSLLASALYFANTWTAKLMADATGNPELGVKAGVLVPLGGVVGALIFAGLSTLMRPRLATVVMMFGGAAAFLFYAGSLTNAALAMVMAIFVGVAANGGAAAYLAISPSIYTAAARATGVGWMIGVARGVSILAPIATGYLLSAGWNPAGTYRLFAGALALSGVACWLLDRTYEGGSDDPETPVHPVAAQSSH